jgi:UDP-glucose 4-epimerase
MRVLVTGGAGFIGSHVIGQLLQAGHEAHGLDDLSTGSRDNLDPALPLHVVNVCDREAVRQVFEQVRPEWVCHQAAQMSVSRSVREPHFDAMVNVMGLVNVLDATVAVGATKFVFASSGGVLYGDVTTPASEEHPPDPISPYGITKWVGERYLKFYAAEHGLKTVALRYSNVYGPRQNPQGEAGVVAIFTTRLLAGEPAQINGDGKYVRDYVYAEDVARANVLSLERDLDAEFVPLNIGTAVGTDVNVLEAALRSAVTEVLGGEWNASDLPGPQHRAARAGDLRSNLVSPARARDVLGWEPRTELAEGLRRTVAWFRGR